VIATGLLAGMIYDFLQESLAHYRHMPAYWFIFATNWAFLLFVISNAYHAILCIIYNFRRDPTDPVCGYGPMWILYEISTTSVVITSVIFWFDFGSLSSFELFISSSSQVKHSLNAVIVAIDILISAIPFRFIHFIYPLAGGIVYSLFNLIYWLLQGPTPFGHSIYPEINWNEPGKTIGIISVILFLVVVSHLLLFVISLTRHFLATLIYGDTSADESEAILKPSESGYSAITSKS